MIRRKLVQSQDEIECGFEIILFLPKITINSTAQQSWKRLGLISREQNRQHGSLLILGGKQTDSGKVPFRCHDTSLGGRNVFCFLSVKRRTDHDDSGALLYTLYEPRDARANLRVVPAVQQDVDPGLL